MAEIIPDQHLAGSIGRVHDLIEGKLLVNGDPVELRLLTDPAKDAASRVLEMLRINLPCKFWLPNVGQEKAILPLKSFDGDSHPKIGVFTGGNGTGKTTTLVNLVAGAAFGVGVMSEFFRDWDIFRKFDEIRKDEHRPIKIRIVCHKTAMEDMGNLYTEIQKWWPRGKYEWQKNHASYFSACTCYGEDGRPTALIQVRTFDQDPRAHAGDTVDLIVVDEPMPQILYSENVGRLRTKRGGLMWFFCTPLEVGGWMKNQLANDDVGQNSGTIVFTGASIWDNCRDWHPDPAMWVDGRVQRGATKDPKKLLTRGHLSKATIDMQIREWRKESPEIAEAREKGIFINLSGAVFKTFNPGVHIIEPFEIPRSWPIYCVMDPHDSRPSFVGWFAHSPDDKIYWIAEYPTSIQWDKADGGTGSVTGTCNAIRSTETPFRDQVVHRFADPNKIGMRYSNKERNVNLQQEYSTAGYRFLLADDKIDVGLSKVRDRLYYDNSRPIGPGNEPSMYFFSRNWWTTEPLTNLTLGMSQWTYKRNARSADSTKATYTLLADEWKDPCDVVRYGVMSLKPFRAVNARRSIFDFVAIPKVKRSRYT